MIVKCDEYATFYTMSHLSHVQKYSFFLRMLLFIQKKKRNIISLHKICSILAKQINLIALDLLNLAYN